MMERWKTIPGYNDRYQFSDRGNVRCISRWDVNLRKFVPDVRLMRPEDNGNGYLIIALKGNGKRKNHYIHRLVAEAFLDKPDGAEVVNHIDYDRYNNRVSNLEWTTQLENVRHSRFRMRHAKPGCRLPNTGERYVHKRKNRYELTINKTYIGSYGSMTEAVADRERLLAEGGRSWWQNQ